MELDSKKKSRRDRMMHSISFDTQEVREIGQKEAGGFPILCMERLSQLNNRRCLPDGRKGMRRPRQIEDVNKKIHARARKML